MFGGRWSLLILGIASTELTTNQFMQWDLTTSPRRWPHPAVVAAFLFLLFVFVPTGAKVVGSISHCKDFFLEGRPPKIPGILESGTVTNNNQYKVICQLFIKKRRFVTLYDINNKIPVFSAYVYQGQSSRGRPKTTWRVEPQVCSRLPLQSLETESQ